MAEFHSKVNPLDTVFSIVPDHSRWEILEEIDPVTHKLQAQRRFKVRCTCGSGIEKILAHRYVRGESLSCGCLKRQRAAEQGRKNVEKLKAGYQDYLTKAREQSLGKYAPKLPSSHVLKKLRDEGMSYREIAQQYGTSSQAVLKRLAVKKQRG
jgi:hypothetical protein